MWTQLLLWAVAVGCCYRARVRRHWSGSMVPLITAVLVALALVPLYATVVEYVGGMIADHL